MKSRPLTYLSAITILAIALFLRGWHLSHGPIFIDEDEYATIARHVAHASFCNGFKICAREGDKPVLLFWVRNLIQPMTGNPVLAGRWLSAVAGVISTWMCYLLGRQTSGPIAGLFAALIYAVCPWAAYHDRQNVHDPAMNALLLASLVMMLKQLDRFTIMTAVAAAVLGALAVFAKPSAVILFLVPPVAYLVSGKKPWAAAHRLSVAIMSAGPLITFLILRIGHLGASTDRFSPMTFVPGNLAVFWDAMRTYLGWGMMLLAVVGIAALWRTARSRAILFTLLTIGWSVVWIVLGNFAPSRYYLPTVACCAILAGAGAHSLVALWSVSKAAGTVASVVITLLIALELRHSLQLLTDARAAPMTVQDDWQYRNSWAAGYAYDNARRWLLINLPWNASIAYLIDPERLEASGIFDPLAPGITSLGYLMRPSDLHPAISQMPLYVMVSDARDGQRTAADQLRQRYPQAREVARFQNIRTTWGVSVLEITP